MTSYMNEKRYRRIDEINAELATNEALSFDEVEALEDEKRRLLDLCAELANKAAKVSRFL
jgi:hypothetical protein